jgi:hypothetical protein
VFVQRHGWPGKPGHDEYELGINGARPGQAAPVEPYDHTGHAALIYFVTMRQDGGGAVRSAGVIAKMTHAFQPSGRFATSNSITSIRFEI